MQLHALPVITLGAEALIEHDLEVKKRLTLEDRFGQEYSLYRHEPGSSRAWIPRGLIHRQCVQSDLTTSRPVQSIAPQVGPNDPDQARVIKESYELLLQGQDHIVEAPTGFGKTYVGAAVASALGQKTLVVVTKQDLIDNWKKTFKNLVGLQAKDIGHVQQDVQHWKTHSVVIAMIHSLCCREYPQEFYQAFGLVIFDEVHRLGADYFVQACQLFPSRHRLGLSATPKRSDGRERMIHAHIGPTMVVGTVVPMKPKILRKRTPWKPPMVNRRDPATGLWKRVRMAVNPGMMMDVCKAMATDVPRNTEICQFVKQAVDAGRWVLVLSDMKEAHLYPLFHMLVALGVPGESIGYYVGGLKDEEYKRARTCRVVLATYAYTAEGTDVPHWDTLVMATPRANVKQPVGRVLRRQEGKKQPVILDLVDDEPVLQGLYFSRLKQYYQLGAEIVEV